MVVADYSHREGVSIGAQLVRIRPFYARSPVWSGFKADEVTNLADAGKSILDRYLANLSVEVEPFALCMVQSGWRLSLPGPPCAMLHFVVEGEGWLSCPDGTHSAIGPNWLRASSRTP